MRVLHTVTTLDPSYGGPAAVARRLMRGLAERGHRVGLMLPQADLDRAGDLRECVALHPVEVAPGAFRGKLPPIARVREILEEYDAALCHELWSAGTFGVCRALRDETSARKPVLLRTAGALVDTGIAHHRLRKAIFLALGHRSNLRSAIRAALLQSFAEAANARRLLPDADLVEFHGGVDAPGTDRPQASAGRIWRRVVTLGRYAPEKGLDVLIRAWGSVAEAFPQWRLEMHGYDYRGEQARLQELIDRLPEAIRQRTVLAGPVTGEEKSRVLFGADLYAQPSRREGGVSIAALEAAAHGLPVLVSHGANSAALTAEGGGEEFPLEAERLAATLREWMRKSDAQRRAAGEAARSIALAEYSWEAALDLLETILESVTGGSLPAHLLLCKDQGEGS